MTKLNIKLPDGKSSFNLGNSEKFTLIAGPCVIESQDLVMEVATKLKNICTKLKINLIFKASFDKANRTSIDSFRGPGQKKGLEILDLVRKELNLPVITDVHEDTELEKVATVVDLLQTPAFLCRQTNFIKKVANLGKPVNIKKAQFLSPEDMQFVLEKAQSTGNKNIILCERGTCFGYNNLISDLRSLVIMKKFNAPVIMDATHSVQQPGGLNGRSGGQREFIPALAKAAIVQGIAGIFLETHPNPDQALSDGPNSWPLDKIESLLLNLLRLDNITKTDQI